MFLSRAALSTTMQTMQTTKQTRRRRRNNRGFGIGLRREERSSGVLVRGRRDDDDDDDDDNDCAFFDPLDIKTFCVGEDEKCPRRRDASDEEERQGRRRAVMAATMSATGYECITARGNDFEAFASDSIDPFANFSPVCPVSDDVFESDKKSRSL